MLDVAYSEKLNWFNFGNQTSRALYEFKSTPAIIALVGYITPIFIGIAGNIGIIVYTLSFVPETNVRTNKKKDFKKLFRQVKEGAFLYKNHGNRRKQLQLVCLT